MMIETEYFCSVGLYVYLTAIKMDVRWVRRRLAQRDESARALPKKVKEFL